MVLYICDRCGFSTSRKSYYVNHINRKKPCTKILGTKGINYDNVDSSKSNSILAPSTALIEVQNINTNDTIYQCEYCHRKLSRKSHLNRHYKTCKAKNSDTISTIITEQLRQKDEQINALLKKTGNVTNNNTQINNNITINAYIKTDFSHITDQDYCACLERASGSVKQFLDITYFNPNRPQNHNVCINNMRSKYGLVHNGITWDIMDQDEIIDDLIDQSHCMLDMKSNLLMKKKPNDYEDVVRKYQKYTELREEATVVKKVREEVKLLLFNARKLCNFNNQRF